jgi:glutathione-regulated potassium-efflux system ancillary protein KefC
MMQEGYLFDAIWLSTAFLMGFAVRKFHLPALIGFLLTGLILNSFNLVQGNISLFLDTLSSLGVMLLLFTIGLKIKLSNILKPEVWVTASAHMVFSVVLTGGFIMALSVFGLQLLGNITWSGAALIGFSLSFSSTVFVVKILEERGELSSYHGKIAIGILVIQDIFAVLFMTIASDLQPGWGILVLPLYVFLIRYALNYILHHSGHGELLTIFGFFATFITGALAFYVAGIKPDLGALIMGMLLVNHPKADELYDRMMSYKDFFLVAFFISVGLTATLHINVLYITLLLIPFLFVKGIAFFTLLSRFNMRSRTAFLTSLSLSNFSEFALITGVTSYNAGWIIADWIIIFALLMAVSFIISSPTNTYAHRLFDTFRPWLMQLNSQKSNIDVEPTTIGNTEYLLVGFGSIGKPAYAYLKGTLQANVIAVDYNHDIVAENRNKGINIIWGDTTNSVFWENIDFSNLKVVLLAMSEVQSNLNTLNEILKIKNRTFSIAAFSNFDDEAKMLTDKKVDYVYNYKLYRGEDFAEQVFHRFTPDNRLPDYKTGPMGGLNAHQQ